MSGEGGGPIKVTVSDPETGEVLAERVVENDYLLLTTGNTWVGTVQRYGNGTCVVTIKRGGGPR